MISESGVESHDESESDVMSDSDDDGEVGREGE